MHRRLLGVNQMSSCWTKPPMIITCTKCGVSKEAESFAPRASARNGRASWCRECLARHNNARYHADAGRRRYQREVDKGLRRRNSAYVDRYLVDKSCVDCGESDRRVLEFDHRDGTEKIGHISTMVMKGFSLQRIANEIEKCDIRCANCHRRRTWETRWRRHPDSNRDSCA